jgi:Domain of unknown function (DUF4267)
MARPGESSDWTSNVQLHTVGLGGGCRLERSIGGDMATPDEIRRVVGCGAIGFGVLAVVSPRLFLALYGMPDEASVRLMTRVWGTRTTVVGALSLLLGNTDDRRALMAAAAANEGLDTLLIATSRAPTRARVLGAATTAGFAAATTYALSG